MRNDKNGGVGIDIFVIIVDAKKQASKDSEEQYKKLIYKKNVGLCWWFR
jgi:hypothetical protein